MKDLPCYRGSTLPMKTYDLPYAIDKLVLNVQADFLQRGIIERDGSIVDLEAFRVALVSSVKKPITVLPGEEKMPSSPKGTSF